VALKKGLLSLVTRDVGSVKFDKAYGDFRKMVAHVSLRLP
jgi:hypothetical protein